MFLKMKLKYLIIFFELKKIYKIIPLSEAIDRIHKNNIDKLI